MLQSDEVKSIIKELNQTDGLIEKIIHVDEFSREFDEEAVQIKAVPASVSAPASSELSEVYRTPPDMTVNFFFNESIPN